MMEAEHGYISSLWDQLDGSKAVESFRTARLRQPKCHRLTRGYIRKGKPAWVYIGVRRDGLVKIGITSDPKMRAADLGIKMIKTFPVVPGSAVAVEAEAIRRLGGKPGEGEWIEASEAVAIAAVLAAFGTVRRYRWVDPEISEDQARQLRISLAHPLQGA